MLLLSTDDLVDQFAVFNYFSVGELTCVRWYNNNNNNIKSKLFKYYSLYNHFKISSTHNTY